MSIELRDRDAELAAAPVLYINQGGRVVCTDPDHTGSYLASALKRNPRVEVVDTPLDNWERLTAAEVVDFAVECEDCRGDFR